MLNDLFKTPILAIALDDMPTVFQEAAESISNLFPDVSEAEIFQSIDQFNQSALSDIAQKRNRIFIPITDKLLPIHYSGGSADSGKRVVNQPKTGVPVLVDGSNSVTLRFEILSSMSQLSTISDMLFSLTNKLHKKQTSSARVSFFGSSICIFNGYLSSVNRSTVDGSNQEIVSMTIEIAQDEDRGETEREKPKTPSEKPNEIDLPPAPSAKFSTYEQIEEANIPTGYNLYSLMSLADIEASGVPQIDSSENVLRRPFTIYNVVSADTNGARAMQTVRYNGQFLALEGYETIKHRGDYFVCRFKDQLIFGIKRNDTESTISNLGE